MATKCWCGGTSSRVHWDGRWAVGSASIAHVRLEACRVCGTIRTSTLQGVNHSTGDHAGGHFLSEHATEWDRLNCAFVTAAMAPGRVLDIGCNTGQLMALLTARGFAMTGVESNPLAADRAAARGLRVKVGRFESGLVANEKPFDAVVMSHVLEHIAEPQNALRSLAELLAPGGRLFVFVPNALSLRARLSPGTWAPLMPVDHVWQFSQESLRCLVQACGCWRVWRCHSTRLNARSPHVWARPIHAVAEMLNMGEQVACEAVLAGRAG